MGSKGSTTSSTNSNQTYNPAGSSFIANALGMAQNAAATPFQGYGGELVAGLSPTQQAGISGVNANANFAQPYIHEAANYARAGAQSPMGNIGQFFNPFTQNVVDATQRQFDAGNQVQQSQLLGNARAQSGVGGDRLAIAQSELAKQQNLTQNPVIAGLYSQNFNQALGAAQQFQQAQSNASYGLGSLGTAGQNAALSGAGAQISAGGLEQGTQQARDTAAYQQFLRQIGYPVQMSQFLTGSVGALAPSLGGTQSGNSNTTSTPAQPSLLGQIAGLGLAGAGLMTGNPMMAMSGIGGATGGGKGSSGGGKGSSGFTGNTSTPFGSAAPGATLSYMGGTPYPMFSDGGEVPGVLHHALSMADAIRRHRNGGAVLDAVRGPGGAFSVPGFAFGGEPGEMTPNSRVSDAFGGVYEALNDGTIDTAGGNFLSPSPPTAPMTGMIPLPRPRPDTAPVMADLEDDDMPLNAAPTAGLAPAFGSTGAPQGGLAPTGFTGELQDAITGLRAERPSPGFAGSPGAALMSAGLGMLASGSPFPGVAIGQGGLKGLSTLEGQRKAEREEADAKARQTSLRGNLAAHGITAEQAAQRLFQSAKQHADTLAETTRHHTAAENNALKPQLTVVGRDEYGNPKYGIFDPKTQTVKDAQPQARTTEFTQPDGGPVPDAVKPPAPPPAQLSEDTELPKNAMLVSGDDAFLRGLSSEDRNMVKAMVEGRQPPPPGKALATPFWRRMMQLASTYDPSFDQGRWASRVQTRKNFATGVEGRIVRSLNTVMNHIDELDEAGKALDNWKEGALGPATKKANEVTNWFRENKGDPRITRFDTTATAVSTELEKAFRGNQTAISGIRDWRKAMSHTMSPEQMAESNKTLTKLLMGQLEGLAGQYSAGMGVNADPLTILQPHAAKTVKKLLGTVPEGVNAGEKPPAKADEPVKAAPTVSRPASVPQGAQYSPSRQQWRDPSGKIYDATGNPVQ